MKFPTQSQYPKVLHVDDATYKIKFVKRIPHEEKRTLGLCDPDTKTIWIRISHSPRGMFRTFIHESLHAIEFEYDLKIKHKMIYSLERALEALVVDNF
jgi:hypothetical protein